MNLTQDQFRAIFQKAKTRFPRLASTDIDLTFNKGWFFTMQAKVNLSSFFSKKRKYSVNVNPRRGNTLSQLSEEDVMGWFGHELAHIADYETMSNSKLSLFILRYLFDIKFRFSVEKRVSAYACNNGFSKELFGVWKKFLVMDGVNKSHQKYIIQNYAPCWEDIQKTAEQEGITEEVYRSFMKV